MNVILIVADTLRADHLGSYGNGWIRTPSLDRLAREGVRFARAYPEALATVPVRRALQRILADARGAIPDYTLLLSPKPGAWYQV